jgi:membrane-associated phospholipid phosphatase
VQEQTNYSSNKITNWGSALQNKKFSIKLLAGMAMLVCILMSFPSFFAFIENRKGAVLNDVVLNMIRPTDVSIPLFIIIWSTPLFFIYRSIYNPSIFLNGVYCFCFLSLVRMLSIYLVALEPPATLIAIKDPLTSLSYGGKDVFITKDLFFSGHTSNTLMLALCFEKKTERLIGYIAAVLVGILVLVQHAHYTIDVVAAFIFTSFIVRFGKKVAAH